MSAITRIRAWSNPGFTEDGPEAPHYGFSLPVPSEDLQNLDYEPSASRIFSEFKIANAVWESWKGMSFLEVTYSWNNSLSNTVLYGFIDEVELLSDTTGAAAVRVHWHVDEWMTYLSQAILGFGHVLRRPVGANDPIQSYERKYWTVDSYTDLLDKVTLYGDRTYWMLLAVGVTENTDKLVKYYTWPFALDDHQYYLLKDGESISINCPRYSDILEGRWDELLGVDPAAIYGAWVLPVPPFDPDFITLASPGDVIALSAGSTWEITGALGTASSIVTGNSPIYSKLFYKKNKTITESVSTELNPLRVTGFSGESVGELPIGISVNSYDYRVVASATECYVEIRFKYGWESKLLGTAFTIPALSVDLTENAWSSYRYSGQREYDIDARNNQSIKSGVESITGGALTGALMGGFGPMGAAAGAVGGAISGGASLGMDFLWFNEAEQGLKDKLAARQTPGILISGGAFDAITNGHDIALCKLVMDSYSAGRAADERSLVGVKVDEYNSSNDTVRASTGFYQIVNLAVTGSIPNSAKRSIANRFAKGVRLI